MEDGGKLEMKTQERETQNGTKTRRKFSFYRLLVIFRGDTGFFLFFFSTKWLTSESSAMLFLKAYQNTSE